MTAILDRLVQLEKLLDKSEYKINLDGEWAND